MHTGIKRKKQVEKKRQQRSEGALDPEGERGRCGVTERREGWMQTVIHRCRMTVSKKRGEHAEEEEEKEEEEEYSKMHAMRARKGEGARDAHRNTEKNRLMGEGTAVPESGDKRDAD